MEPTLKADLLKDEYIMLQTLYADVDGKSLTIKNWAITVSLAIVGASFVQNEKNLLWLAFAASLIFWYLDAYWRGLSHFLKVRIMDIEKVMQDNTWQQEVPLQVYTTWTREYKVSGDQTFRYMFKRASLLPHVMIPVFTVILYFVLSAS